MINLCVRGMMVNGDNPKNLVGYIYRLIRGCGFQGGACGETRLGLFFFFFIIIILFVFLLGASLDFSLRLYHYLLRRRSM